MDLIKLLLVEHKVILRQLHYLEKLIKVTRSRKDVCCLREMTLLIADAVQRHSKTEDKFLFPDIGRYLHKDKSFIAMMEFEHGEILGIMPVLEGTENPKVIVKEIENFIKTLRTHFLKEENNYFPFARRQLGSNRLRILGNKAMKV